MTWHGGSESARLARALDSGPGRRGSDPAVDELLDLTDRLSRVDTGVRLDPAFRTRTRQRLITLAELQAAGHAPAAPRSPLAAALRRSRESIAARQLTGIIAGRRLAGIAAVLSLVIATAGVLALSAGNALPGDALYAVKRGTEQVRLSLTWDRGARGFVLLHFAETRLDEVGRLIHDPVTEATATPEMPLAAGKRPLQLISSTLSEMDRQTQSGIALLTAYAVARSDESVLNILPAWADGQRRKLDILVTRMSPAERDRADVSLTLLHRVDNRARMLSADLACDCLDTTDELGPLPCVQCTPAPGTPAGTPGAPVTATPNPAGSAQPDPAESEPSPSSTGASEPGTSVPDPPSPAPAPTPPAAEPSPSDPPPSEPPPSDPSPTDPSPAEPTPSEPAPPESTPPDPGAVPTPSEPGPSEPGAADSEPPPAP